MTELTTDLQQKEKSAQLLWTAFILMFFLIQAVIWTVAISLTAGDKSHMILANYDERALNWDDEVAKRHASDKLGWQAEFHFDASGDVQSYHVLSLTIQGPDEQPVSNASVQLTCFHRAYAALPQEITLKEVGLGVYSGKIRVTRSGRWQVEGTATQNENVLLINQQIDLTASH